MTVHLDSVEFGQATWVPKKPTTQIKVKDGVKQSVPSKMKTVCVMRTALNNLLGLFQSPPLKGCK